MLKIGLMRENSKMNERFCRKYDSRYLVVKVVDMSRWMNAYEIMDDVNRDFYTISSKWSVSKDKHRYYSYYVWYLVNGTAS